MDLRERTILPLVNRANKFMASYKPSAENFAKHVSSYMKPKSRDNEEIAMRHLARFLGIPYKGRLINPKPKELLIAPTDTEVKAFLSAIKDSEVRLYLALLATTLIRPERLWLIRWEEVSNGFILIQENVRTKNYRPNPIHPQLLHVLEKCREEGRVFPEIGYTSLRRIIKSANRNASTSLTRAKLRDYAYNAMRKAGVDRDIVDWLAGHTLGIRAHYLADNIKEEYLKFVAYSERVNLLGSAMERTEPAEPS